jgi:flagellar motor switch protein FliN/FliY
VANESSNPVQRIFSTSFLEAFASGMSKDSGTSWKIADAPNATSETEDSERVRITVNFEGTLQGALLLEFSNTDVALLASKLLGQEQEEFGPEHSEALVGLLDRIVSDFGTALQEEYGAFSIKASESGEASAELGAAIQFIATDDAGSGVSLSLSIDPALSQSLDRQSKAKSASKAVDVAHTASAAEQVNLDLVMDVELNVTLRFGQRQLTLRDVLELTSGSVIELDRQVEEPVELLLEGKVIARGEAVVIDGNYGLRVTEVPQAVSSAMLR